MCWISEKLTNEVTLKKKGCSTLADPDDGSKQQPANKTHKSDLTFFFTNELSLFLKIKHFIGLKNDDNKLHNLTDQKYVALTFYFVEVVPTHFFSKREKVLVNNQSFSVQLGRRKRNMLLLGRIKSREELLWTGTCFIVSANSLTGQVPKINGHLFIQTHSWGRIPISELTPLYLSKP